MRRRVQFSLMEKLFDKIKLTRRNEAARTWSGRKRRIWANVGVKRRDTGDCPDRPPSARESLHSYHLSPPFHSIRPIWPENNPRSQGDCLWRQNVKLSKCCDHLSGTDQCPYWLVDHKGPPPPQSPLGADTLDPCNLSLWNFLFFQFWQITYVHTVQHVWSSMSRQWFLWLWLFVFKWTLNIWNHTVFDLWHQFSSCRANSSPSRHRRCSPRTLEPF